MPTPSAIAPLCLVSTIAAAGSVATAQCPPVRFVSPDGADAFRFGGPLAMASSDSGTRVAIAQDRSVWTFDLVDGQLVDGQRLAAPFAEFTFGFGRGVDIEGDRMAIGADQVRWPGQPTSLGGSAVYDRVDGAWAFTGVLRPPLGVTAESAVSRPVIDGDTIIGAGGFQGSIIVYEPSASTIDGWAPIQVIERPAGMADDAGFGFDVAAGDGWLFIGAYNNDFPPSYGAGSVVIYRRQADGAYEFVQQIDGPDMGPYRVRVFGRSIDFDGRTLAVAAAGASVGLEGQGAVYVFELDGDRWTLRQTLTHRGPRDGHQFGGTAVQVEGDRLVAQAWGDKTVRSDRMAYAFERTDGGVWRQSARLFPVSPYHTGQFGGFLALHGDHVLASSTRECEGPGTPETGAAYLFDLSCYACPDLDGDDVLTVFDSLEFLRAFEAGEAIADFDNDGQLTTLDFLAFQDAFAVGCP